MPSQSPFPLMPPKSTEVRLSHFDEYVYTADNTTNLYRFVDALCGTVGAGALVNELFLARMAGALETIYFNELDYIFAKVAFLSRSPAESYPYNPLVDMLTSDQWDEVKRKDAWYRARVKEFFYACTLGGTPEGIKMAVRAAIAVDADLYEVWRYIDNFGITDDLGRAPETARNELVVRPHKSELSQAELRLLRDMLEKIAPLDTIVTVSTQGLNSLTPVSVSASAADSTYYEVQKMVTATPAMDLLPQPELLPIDLLPTEQWLYLARDTPTLAPYVAFNISAEFGYYYLVGGGKRSPIDSVTYGTLQSDGSVRTEHNYQVYDTIGSFAAKQLYEKADSPDNYPGGKYGIHPTYAPARNPDHTPYIFPYPSQSAYNEAKAAEVVALGGRADDDGYQMPIQQSSSTARVFWPDYAIAYDAPTQDSTVSASLTRRRGQSSTLMPEIRDPNNFVR